MATFEEQVESLTGLTINSSGTVPTQSQLTDFLTQGGKDVINRMVAARPDTKMDFAATTEDDNNEGIAINGEIISVVREHDSTSILRPCSKINEKDRYLATDTSSLKYRSKINPGWYELNSKVYVVPVSAGSDNSSLVTQVAYPAIPYGDTNWSYPAKYETLITYYAAMMSLLAKAGSLQADSDVTTALSAATTELGLANAEIDKMAAESGLNNAELDKATAEITEAVTLVDAAIDTATAAMVTAGGRINTATVLANAEFDKSDTILDKGEVDTETAVNTALAAIVTEVGECLTIADSMHTAAGNAGTEIGLAKTEAAEIASFTDTGSGSSDINVALAAMNTAADKFRASGDDPGVFGNEDNYHTVNSGITRVMDALDKARTLLTDDAEHAGLSDVTDEPSTGTYSALFWLGEEDPEMVDASLKIVNTELKRAETNLQEWNATITTLSAEIDAFKKEAEARIAVTSAKGQSVKSYTTTAQTFLQQADSFGKQIASKIEVSQAYGKEIEARLNQARAKREESKSRIELGSAYLGEAKMGAEEVQSYGNEINARISQVNAQINVAKGYIASGEGYSIVARGYREAAEGYINTATKYLEEASGRMKYLYQEYGWYINRYTSIQQKYDDAFMSEEQVQKRKVAMQQQMQDRRRGRK